MSTWPASSAVNALRSCLPGSLRTGMFCRFGSVQLMRPVAVTVCWKWQCMRPSSAISGSMPST